MTILNIAFVETGLVGVKPNLCLIETNNTLAQVTATGFLNEAVAQGNQFSDSTMACVVTKTSPSAASAQVGWLEVQKSGANWNLVPTGAPGSVTLPTIANHIATFTNTTGNLSEDAATAINGGNLQAGLSGTPGYFASFPATAARGSLRLVAANSAGDTVTQITNASQAAARVYTIPDGGQSASNFLLTDSAGTQTIATGSLALTLGNITAAAGNIVATLGNITATAGAVAAGTTVTAGTNLVAGASGSAGTIISFPATAANGTLIISAANAGGAFNTTLRNGTMAQSTVYTIGDIGAATGGIPVSTGAIRMKMVADAAVAGGAASNNVVDAFCTAASVVQVIYQTQTNAAVIRTVVPGAGSFDVITDVDPGSSTINYVIYK